VDDFAIRGIPTLYREPLAADLGSMTPISLASSADWREGSLNGRESVFIDGSSGDAAANDYLISEPIEADAPFGQIVSFEAIITGNDSFERPLRVLYSTDYDPANGPEAATFTDITPEVLDTFSPNWRAVETRIDEAIDGVYHLAFQYQSSGFGQGNARTVGVRQVRITPVIVPQVDFGVSSRFGLPGDSFSFTPTVIGGIPPFEYAWDFGDGNGSTAENPSHTYNLTGEFDVSLIVTDDGGQGASVETLRENAVTIVSSQETPEVLGSIRVAAFNIALAPGNSELNANTFFENLENPANEAASDNAEIIQRVQPDVLLINEFNYPDPDAANPQNWEEDQRATNVLRPEFSDELAGVNLFKQNFLEVPQAADVEAAVYPYVYIARSNTGLASGENFDRNAGVVELAASTDYAQDAFGFGVYPGQYAMLVLSKFPIDTDRVRSFQLFRWVDMPNALLPEDPTDSDGDNDVSSWYSEDALEIFRLSSKSHWDVPVLFKGQRIHILASHPTPPVFDTGGIWEPGVDHNGRRNHDEIRFWADYIDPDQDDYIYDDAEWVQAGNQPPAQRNGGLGANQRFVVMGDQNADPVDGDATRNPIALLLENPLVDTTMAPESDGADEAISSEAANRRTKTSDFGLRADYVLPSTYGFNLRNAEVFWPVSTDPLSELLDSSDHRLVFVDLDVVRESADPQPSLSFEDWKRQYAFFQAGDANQDAQDDPDDDNETNFDAFIFVRNPLGRDSKPTQIVRVLPDDRTSFEFSVRDSDKVAWRVISTNDLMLPRSAWDEVQEGNGVTINTVPNEDDPSALDVTVLIDNAGDQSAFYGVEAAEMP